MAFKNKAAFTFTLLFTMPQLRSALATESRISERSERIDAASIPKIEDLFLEYTQYSWFRERCTPHSTHDNTTATKVESR